MLSQQRREKPPAGPGIERPFPRHTNRSTSPHHAVCSDGAPRCAQWAGLPEVTSLALRAPLHAATRRSGSAAAAAAKDELSHPAGGAGPRAGDELMPARCRRTDGRGGGGHADSVAHPMTRATLQPVPSQEDGAQSRGSVQLGWWSGMAMPPALCLWVFIASPATPSLLLGSCRAPRPVPSGSHLFAER